MRVRIGIDYPEYLHCTISDGTAEAFWSEIDQLFGKVPQSRSTWVPERNPLISNPPEMPR